MLRKTCGVQLETPNFIGPGISLSQSHPDDHGTAFRLTAKTEAFYWPDGLNFCVSSAPFGGGVIPSLAEWTIFRFPF
jgi:hypothetical protein